MELKTLKDMRLFFASRKKLEEEFYEYAKKNRVDNTVIKDCPMNVIAWFCGKRDKQIKQEAIKHVRAIQKSGKDQKTKGELIMFLGYFFNITEEDLK